MEKAKPCNLAKFTALAHLLSLRNNGATESPAVKSFESADYVLESSSEASTCTTCPELLSSSREDGILRRLLNRLSELLAVEKRGPFVSAAMLREDEKEDCADIWVARNSGFSEKDHSLMNTIAKAMTTVAKGIEGVCSSVLLTSRYAHLFVDVESAGQGLWTTMLVYSTPRIDIYRKDLMRLYRCNRRVINDTLSKDSNAGSELSDTLRRIFAELATHVSGHTNEKKEEKLERLVKMAYEVRKLASSKDDIEMLLADPGLAANIHTGICFLGRVRAAYETCVTTCLTVWRGFEVRIHPVTKPQSVKAQSRRLDLSEAFSIIGLALDDTTLKTYINRRGFTQQRAVMEFENLQNQKSSVHAEIQLVITLHEQDILDYFPYVGSSKLNCFLCAEFLSVFGGLRSRGCHGRPYSRWLILDTTRLRPGTEKHVWDVIKTVEERIEAQLRLPLTKGNNFKAESTAGLTDGSASLTHLGRPESHENPLVHKFLHNRNHEMRQQQLSLQFNPRETKEQEGHTSVPEEYDDEARSENDKAEQIEEDECEGGHCYRITSRRCGKCGKDFFCSTRCEAEMSTRHAFRCNLGRSLTTADYLMLDIADDVIPEDSDVLTDFGFQTLLPQERSKLLGLYIRLSHLGVKPEELHQWQQSGSLVEYIVETFSTLGEGGRGHYFPWFLANHHRNFCQKECQPEEKLQSSGGIEEYFNRARIHLEPQDREKPTLELQPESKTKAFFFFSLVMQSSHPPPTLVEAYIDFGFCVCKDEMMEMKLGGLYQELLFGDTLCDAWMPWTNDRPSRPPLCTFTEFWQAFDEGGLTQLMDSRGLQSKRKEFPHLPSVLNRRAGDPVPSVWMLQAFLNDERGTVAPDSIMFDYGFVGSANSLDMAELKDFYRNVLTHADHLDLEKASAEHKLLAFGMRHAHVSANVAKLLSSALSFLQR